MQNLFKPNKTIQPPNNRYASLDRITPTGAKVFDLMANQQELTESDIRKADAEYLQVLSGNLSQLQLYITQNPSFSMAIGNPMTIVTMLGTISAGCPELKLEDTGKLGYLRNAVLLSGRLVELSSGRISDKFIQDFATAMK
jgi:hypothetical protein